MRPLLNVACAIIEHNGRVLSVQRSSRMRQPLLWEFPGGKLNAGEQAADCVVREINEELGILVEPAKKLSEQENGFIRLIPFICRWVSGQLQLHEHAQARWLKTDGFSRLSWCPADVPVWKEYIKIKKENS